MNSRPQGRPRPTETIERDHRVLDLLRQAPRTRNELRELLGMDPGTETRVYLSLRRLSRPADGPPRVRMSGRQGRERVWEALDAHGAMESPTEDRS